VPIFWTLVDRWPTPQSLAKGQPFLSSIPGVVSDIILADPMELKDHIRCLGLQSIRARRLIALSSAYVCLFAYHDHGQESYPDHTLISHLPGSGPYALDSYRIYCGGPDAWRTVVPCDKELIKYIVRLSYAEC
jgi:methyl-CpG-binding domain protein 4